MAQDKKDRTEKVAATNRKAFHDYAIEERLEAGIVLQGRARTLLLHKKEIRKLIGQTQLKGLTLVPLRIYFSPRGHAKVELALARGKKEYDRRETIKEREAGREMERAMKDGRKK